MFDLDVLDDCDKMLNRYESLFLDRVVASGQVQDAPAVMLQRGLAFGRETLKAMRLLLSEGNYALQACAVCRGLFEIAIRLLWASRAPDGWPRLHRHWCQEEVKWAERAAETPHMRVPAEAILESSRQALAQLNASSQRGTQAAPGMRETLLEIEQHNAAEAPSHDQQRFAKFSYPNIWLVLCWAAHAHIEALDLSHPEAHIRWRGQAVYATVMAVWALVETFCHVMRDDVARAGEPVLELLERLGAGYRQALGAE